MKRRTVVRAALFGAPAVAAAAIGGTAINRVHENGGLRANQRDPSWLWDPFEEEKQLPPALGVHFHGTWDMYYPQRDFTPSTMFYGHLDKLAAHGVQVLRVDVGWSASQPNNAPPSPLNTYNRRIQVVLEAAAARKMDVLLTLHQSPEWSRPGTSGGMRQFPTNPELIYPWAAWLAATYGDKVLAYEVWNEPNLREFTGVDDPRARPLRYVPLLRAACLGLKAGDPDAVVVFGGPSKNDDRFIRACYELGAKPFFDVMSTHPYQGNQTVPPDATDQDSPSRMTHFPAVLEVMADHDDLEKPVWWTEFGFSVHPNGGVPTSQPWRYGVPSEAMSAEFLYRSFELARREYPQVSLAIVYTAYKPTSDPAGHQFGYRLIDVDGTLRPQLPTLRGYQAAFGGSRSPLPDFTLPGTPAAEPRSTASGTASPTAGPTAGPSPSAPATSQPAVTLTPKPPPWSPPPTKSPAPSATPPATGTPAFRFGRWVPR
jgi:hypothetical protein